MPDRREPTVSERAAGQVLKAIRTEKGLAPTLVAYRLKMGERNLLRYESGEVQLSALQIGDFARALEVDPRALFDRLYPLLRLHEEIGLEPPKRVANHFRREHPARSVVGRVLAGAGA